MSEKYYKGGCQCGAVDFETDVDINNAITCNCSRCKPMGFVLAFTPAEKFRLKSGSDKLTEYLFNKKEIRHLFCSICGVESFAYGESAGHPMVAINLNCLEGVDTRELNPNPVDGASV
ncbi:GFA family protein [Microbulbifer epialgicus]|uniref:GFA family protein n=1 Tax=Microbulbifer epialgicus TaxID=393907 RepID=A0ABV4P4T6_9GAMM